MPLRRAMPHHAVLILILTVLLALGPLTIDMYLPALPSMQRDLGASEGAIQLTVTGATIGFGLGQLVVGPLSDSVGRRRPLLVAAAVHVAASAGVALARDLLLLDGLRFVQGMGCTAASVVAVAIVRDLYRGQRYVRASADLGAVAGLSPIVATLAGTGLLLVVDWRWVSIIIAGYGLVGAIAATALIPETLDRARRHAIGVRALVRRYAALGRDRRYVGATAIGVMGWSVLFANLSASPFLLQRTFGLGIGGYGVVFASLTVANVVSGQLTSRLLIPRWGPTRLIPLLGSIAMVGAVGILAGAVLWPASLAGLLIPLVLTLMATAGMTNCAGIVAISGQRAQAGTAASLSGALNFLTAGVVTAVVGALGAGSAAGMAAVMAVAVAAAIAVSFALRRLGDPAELTDTLENIVAVEHVP